MPSEADSLMDVWTQPWFERYVAEAEHKKTNFRRTAVHLMNFGLSDVKSRPRVLDFGCSIGLFLQVGKEYGWDMYGVETDTAVARYGQEILGQTIFNGGLLSARFADNYFDAVVSFQVFEHLPDPARELDEIYRILCVGGLLAIDVPSIDNVWYRLLKDRHRHFATPQHIYFYTPATMSMLLERAGFQLVAIDFPPRSLSFEHVCKHHVRLYSQKLSRLLVGMFSKLGWLGRSVSVNLKDVMCVYARKGC